MDDVAFLRLVQSEDKLISKTLHEGIQHLEFKEQCAKTSARCSKKRKAIHGVRSVQRASRNKAILGYIYTPDEQDLNIANV